MNKQNALRRLLSISQIILEFLQENMSGDILYILQSE